MKKHEDLATLIATLRDWKSPDGVLQVKDLKWFKDLKPQMVPKLTLADLVADAAPRKEQP